ncbi:MAG: type VI secretion system protein TssA [Nitrospinae bacterium]|nr:type VI secretion system protein TssA [Nitrospinota bacterium]
MSEKTVALTIDLEKLLAPISVEHPAGESLRYEGTYDRIQTARREDDASLPQGIWKTSLKKADWQTVRDICLEALETRSKDLHIAVWLLEAWLHVHGFSGVREGLRLVIGLCEGFWDELYPAMEGEDLDYRVAPLVWMNEKVSTKLKLIPITQPQGSDQYPYTWAEWESASHLENLASRDRTILQDPEIEGKVTQGMFRGSAMLTPISFYISLAEELDSTMDATTALSRLLDEKCGNKAPSLVQFREALVSIQRLVHDILAERSGEVAAVVKEQPAGLGVTEEEDEQGMEALSAGGPIRTRAEAYRRLLEAAEYLLKTEPHSPTPYLIKRAVSWGSMSLTELLQELVGNERDREAIYILLGMRKNRRSHSPASKIAGSWRSIATTSMISWRPLRHAWPYGWITSWSRTAAR